MAHNWTESHQWSTHQTSQCRIRGCVWVRGACHGPSRWPAVKVTLPLTVTAERSTPSDRVSCQQPERWRKSDHPDRLRRRDEGADGQDAHRVTAWLTVVASSAQSAAEHGVCLDLLSFVFPPRFPAWRCVPCSVWLRQTPEQTVWTESEILRLRHPNPAVSRQIQMNLPRTRLHGPWRLILRQILGILLRYGGLGGGMVLICSSSYMPDYSMTSGVPPQLSVSRSTFVTCQHSCIENIPDDCPSPCCCFKSDTQTVSPAGQIQPTWDPAHR